MPFDSPFTLGPFIVDPAGRLLPDVGTAPSFRIGWRGRTVHIGMEHGQKGLGLLRLWLPLARIPSTAPSGAMLARDEAFATVRGLPGEMPPGWSVTLLADHRLVLEATAHIPLPASACALVTELTVFLLRVDPYLTLLEETGLELAAVAGNAKT